MIKTCPRHYVTIDCSTPLHHASAIGDIEKVRSNLSLIEETDYMAQTALHYASHYGHIEVVRILLTVCGVDLQDVNGKTALHLACCSGKSDIAKILLDGGADVDVCDKFDSTALLYACQLFDVATVKLLLLYSADINFTNKFGTGALLHVSWHGNLELLKILLEEESIEIDKKNLYGQTALFGACDGGHVNVVRMLLDAGADMSLEDDDGWTALHAACFEGHDDVSKMLALEKKVPMLDVFEESDGSPSAISLSVNHFTLDDEEKHSTYLLLDSRPSRD